MVDFQQTPKPRNYLARREQWRLLLLVMALGLVGLMMCEARDPANFAWIAALDDDKGNNGDGTSGDATTADAQTPIDNRLAPPPRRDEIPGTFVSPAEVEPEAETTGRYFPGVRPEYFESIRDDTTFRHQERMAWFNLLDVLNKSDESALRKGSIGRVTFAQLFTQSRDYRGELVTLAGSIRRAHRLTAPKNDCGIEKYYQMWLQPADNPTSPMVIYCLYLPEGFPTGMDLSEEVELTGFFFKRWAYKAQDSLRTAPTVLARTVHWEKAQPVAGSRPVDLGGLLGIVAVAAVFSLVVVIYVFTRGRPGRSSKIL